MPRLQRASQALVNTVSERTIDEVLDALATAEVEVLGLLPYSSNFVFLARVGAEPDGVLAIYKPTRGERPLWDFPPETLAAREAAAFLVSRAGGWGFVPPTVLRADAPLGPGSLQLFIDHDPERHYFVMYEERLAEFEAFAAFDIVVNNADRKAGHVLEDASGRLWGVDHGLTFNVEPKLRTVIWEFGGEPATPGVLGHLEQLRAELATGSSLTAQLRGLLDEPEVVALIDRTEGFLADPTYPVPTSQRQLPWPLV